MQRLSDLLTVGWPVRMVLPTVLTLCACTGSPVEQAGDGAISDLGAADSSMHDLAAVDAASAAPIAAIDPDDSTALVGGTVELDGSGSSDPLGGSLSYLWHLVAQPPGSQAQLSSTTTPSVSLTVDRPGTFVVQLVVEASLGRSSTPATALIRVSADGDRLIANAGPDQTVYASNWVSLDGSASFDPEGEDLAYTWRFVAKPAASTSALLDADTVSPTFLADVEGQFDVELVVRAGGRSSEPDQVSITVGPTNYRPVADAGSGQYVAVGTPVSLDGSGSSDPDDDPLSYRWTIARQPATSSATLTGAQLASASFTPQVAGFYAVKLTVDDGHGHTDDDLVPIIATAGGGQTDLFNPDDVYLAGTLSEGACYRDAIAPWQNPNTAAIGFDCYFDERDAVIRPSDGRLLYSNTFEDIVRVFSCDACPYSGGDYAYDAANDTPVPTPCPVDTSVVTGFLVSPQGTILHTCTDSPAVWRDLNGTEVYDGSSDQLLHVGENGLALTTTRVLNLATQAETPISGLPDRNRLTTRALGDRGFWLVLVGSPDADPPELWTVSAAGVATQSGTYPPLTAGLSAQAYSSKLDGQGALFQFGSDQVAFNDLIIRREVGGTTDVVYSEEADPMVKIHISGLVTGP